MKQLKAGRKGFMKKQQLMECIRDFALQQSGAVTLDDLVECVQQREPGFDDDDRLYNIACESGCFFEDERVDDEYVFIPRHCFFKGAEFRVKPLPEEVEGGFLIPGHRFVPFICRSVFPSKAVLTLPDGSAAETRSVALPVDTARKCLVFFGEMGLIDYLIVEDRKNASCYQPPFNQPVELTVFDLRAFYRQSGFKSGDTLMLTVEDWLKGAFSVRHLPAQGRAVDFAATHAWAAALRQGFEQMRSIESPSADCTEQMALMLCCAELDEESPSVLSNPPMTLPEFFNKQKDLTIKSMNQLSFFWPVDEPVEERWADIMDEDDLEPETELDALFQLLNLSLDAEDAEAYMRDALAGGGDDPLAVLDRVLHGRTVFFPNEMIRQELIDLWTELWDDVCERHDPSDDNFREGRTVFLRLNDQCLKILRDLDKTAVTPQEMLTNPAYLQLTEMSTMIHSALVMGNQPDAAAESLPIPLDQVESMIGSLLDAIAAELLPQNSGRRGKMKKGPVYQLKITLMHSKPPIWRRVLVPAEMPLEKLHDVIQAVFGWGNAHLHQFIKDGLFYQPDGGGDRDFFPMKEKEDSHECRVCDLLCREKDTLLYEYDFGDSWDHQVVLEKIREPKKGELLPLCVKGARACPPDDCGGIGGYYQLLETLNGPECTEKEELLDWAGGPIDPEVFSLAAANSRLQRL